MTTLPSTVRPPASPLRRVLNVARLHLVNRQVYVGIPWLILAGSFAVTIIIALLINYATGDPTGSKNGFQYSCKSSIIALPPGNLPRSAAQASAGRHSTRW